MRFKSHGLIYQMRLPGLTNRVTGRMNFLHVSMTLVRVREKVFRNSGFRLMLVLSTARLCSVKSLEPHGLNRRDELL